MLFAPMPSPVPLPDNSASSYQQQPQQQQVSYHVNETVANGGSSVCPSVASAVSQPASAESLSAAVSEAGMSKSAEKRARKEEKQRRKEERSKRKRGGEEKAELMNNESSPSGSVVSGTPSSQIVSSASVLSTITSNIGKKKQKLANESPAPVTYHGGTGGPIGRAPVPTLADGYSLPLAADSATTAKGPDSGSASVGCVDYSSSMVLKPDHALRPIIVLPTGYIYLDMNNPFSKPAADFLSTVAEPVSRPENIHEFQITVFSLYAAVGAGISIDDLIKTLSKFSKNVIPSMLDRLLKLHGCAFGRVKLVLRNNRYYLEATTKEDLEYMLSHPVIAESRVRNSIATRQIRTRPTTVVTAENINEHQPTDNLELESAEAPSLDPTTLGFKLTEASAEPSNIDAEKKAQQNPTNVPAPAPTHRSVYLFEVMADKVGKVKECALTELKRPLVSEYDFRKDQKNPTLDIALKPVTRIRYYQERALRKMFSNGRARSGIIVLPCGAGKTLTGITAATTIRKSAMVLTSSSVAVDQWRRSFVEFTTVDPANVVALTADRKQDLPAGAGILVSTYTMMAYSGRRSDAAERILQQIRSKEWGLLVFDEVQFAPAPAFRKINDLVRSHCKLGLTATLVREDDLIHDLQWLIGPKLYEANWLELQEAGFLAKVQVSEVWCPMTAPFYKEYLVSPHAKQRKLWVCNPNKARVCEYLLKFHEARGDKIIIFSDNLFALKEIACTLKKPFISGEVGMQERMVILNKFKSSNKLNTIFLSKVGDNAIDIPCANVVIQISFNFASRRQEAQRLGRILRPKPKADNEFNAFFYSLVSKDTQEMLYADKRQQFIIDQGYAYKVLPITVFPMETEQLVFDDPKRQQDLLDRILATSDAQMDLEDDDVVLNDSGVDVPTDGPDEAGAFSVRQTSLAKMSGMGAGMTYRETRATPPKKKEPHPFFKSYRR